MSSRGWSFYEKDAHCPALPFAVRQGQGNGGGFDSSAPALVKGSIGHLMQAHHLAREGCRQGGVFVGGEWSTDEGDWLPPEEAAHEYCQDRDDWRFFDEMVETFRGHVACRPHSLGRILAVETEHFGVIGTKAGQWGYWVVDPLMADWLKRPVAEHPADGLMAVDGESIICDPLDVEGHREHGFPVWMSRRDDADIDMSRGIFIVDHKHKGFVNAKEIVAEYSMEDGMCAFRHIGSQVYGPKFGGVAVHAIQVGSGLTVFKELRAFPEHDRLFAHRLWTRAHEMFQRQVHSDGSEYKGWRGGKSNCIRFGRPCDGFKFCFGADDI